MVTVWTSLNNLKTKIDDLGVGKLKTVPVDLKKLIDVVSKEVVNNTSKSFREKTHSFDYFSSHKSIQLR